jgi:hypothetical protein
LTPPNQVKELGLVFVLELQVNMDMFVNISSQQRWFALIHFFSLYFRDLSGNQLTGHIPNVSGIQCLETLKLPWDWLNTTNGPQCFATLSCLTSWSLLGPRVEVGLTFNFMKGIHIFPFQLWGHFFSFFLPSKLDVLCMIIVKKEHNKILFQNPFKLMFNKYNTQCKVGEGHLNSIFYKEIKIL